jgi:hypothetical protein
MVGLPDGIFRRFPNPLDAPSSTFLILLGAHRSTILVLTPPQSSRDPFESLLAFEWQLSTPKLH